MIRATALCIALLASSSAIAQEVSPDAQAALHCGVAFDNHSKALEEAGDVGGATEFRFRGEELLQRGELMLVNAGFDAQGVEDVVMNTVIKTSFEYPFDPDGMIEDCIRTVVDEDSP
jgi:hypothetical protein